MKNNDPRIQLYNLSTDIAERQNLATKYPEKVESLLYLLEAHVKKGRTTPGSKLKNDVEVDIWKTQINYSNLH